MTPKAREAILEHREALKSLADTELACAELAEKLLEVATVEEMAP